MQNNTKVICSICNFKCLTSDLLLALNPFDPTEPIHGCPKCRTINSHIFCDVKEEKLDPNVIVPAYQYLTEGYNPDDLIPSPKCK